MNILIVWDDIEVANELYSSNVFEFALPKDTEKVLKHNGPIAVLCELSVNEKGQTIPRTQCHGVEWVQQLRLKGLAKPVLFVSFLPPALLLNGDAARQIVFTIGHGLAALPLNGYELVAACGKIRALREFELLDIQQSYCGREGMIREIVHVISSIPYMYRDGDFEKGSAQCKTHFERICSLFGLPGDNHWVELLAISRNDLSQLINEIEVFSSRLLAKDHGEEVLDTQSKHDSRNWELLWVDDEGSKEHILVKALENKGIKVHFTTKAQDALDMLSQSWEPLIARKRISVVLSDYRLLEDRDGVQWHQPVQGYELLRRISEMDLPVKGVALSALPRKFLMKSFRYLGLNAQVFSKKDYLQNAEGVRILAEQICEIGDQNDEAISYMPVSISWRDSFAQGYIRFRNHPDYEQMEKIISDKATALWSEFKKGKSICDKVGFSKGNFNPNVKKFEKMFPNLEPRLIGRRLALAIYLQQGSRASNQSVLSELCTMKSATALSIRQVLFAGLGLSLADFPFNMTLEDKYWLEAQGFKVWQAFDTYREVRDSIANAFEAANASSSSK
jgi:CheY-like chemotaxis protein